MRLGLECYGLSDIGRGKCHITLQGEIAADGAYAGYLGYAVQSYFSVFWCIVSFVAAIGLWLRRPWTQYPVYLLSAIVVVVLPWEFWKAIQQHAWPYERLSASLVGLFITLCPFAFAIGSSVVTYRFFRAQS
jgi:hypothetical protein